MNFPFYIAKRYLFAKKSHNMINVISGISMFGVMTGTLALVVVLSVFNGFEALVVSLFSSFNPAIEITPNKGKVFIISEQEQDQLMAIPGVINYVEVVQENALLKYNDQTVIATLKGVGPAYLDMVRLDTLLVEGIYSLGSQHHPAAMLAYGIAYELGLEINDVLTPLTVYMPKRGKHAAMDPSSAFRRKSIAPAGIFSIQQEIDNKYVVVPVDFIRALLDYSNEVSAIEIGLSKRADVKDVQQSITLILGNQYQVKNKYQQQGTLFRILQSEKLMVFIILSFILLIAACNLIGTLSMIMIDKKKDIGILGFLGANHSQVKRVFYLEGFMIMMAGAITGLICGFLICWLQQTYGIVSLQSAGSFLVDAYPVKMKVTDFAYVLLVDVVIAAVTIRYPVRMIAMRYMR